jgi:hypothetical protein
MTEDETRSFEEARYKLETRAFEMGPEVEWNTHKLAKWLAHSVEAWASSEPPAVLKALRLDVPRAIEAAHNYWASERDAPVSGYALPAPTLERALALNVSDDDLAAYVRRESAKVQAELFADLDAAGRPSRDYSLTNEDELDESAVGWLLHSFLPSSGRLLLSAQRKTGKTTMLLQLVRSLLGDPHEKFLGAFAVEPLTPNERIVFLNYEVSAPTFRRWIIAAGIEPDDRRFIRVHLAGKANPLATRRSRELFADRLRGLNVRLLVVDPFSNAFASGADEPRDENDVAAVGPFLYGLDDLMAAAEIPALVLSAHAGWSADGRSRGSSKIEDWPDTIAHLTTADQSDPGATRYLDLRGREVEAFAKRGLVFDSTTGQSTITDRGPKKAGNVDDGAREIVAEVVALVEESGGGWSVSQVRQTFRSRKPGNSDTKIGRALDFAHEDGLIQRARDGQTVRHYLPGTVPKKMRSLIFGPPARSSPAAALDLNDLPTPTKKRDSK